MFHAFRDRSDPDRRLERELEALEKQARRAVLGFDARFFNRAGDLCLDAGKQGRALKYYGRTIDAYLKAGRFDSAAAVCRKLLRISPNAVRARCTLAWLSIGKGHLGDAHREVADYVRAAREAHQDRIAVQHLRLMGEATADDDLQRLLSEQLSSLNADDFDDLLTPAFSEDGDAAGSDDPEARWEKVLRAALMGPNELNE